MRGRLRLRRTKKFSFSFTFLFFSLRIEYSDPFFWMLGIAWFWTRTMYDSLCFFPVTFLGILYCTNTFMGWIQKAMMKGSIRFL